MGQNQTIGQAAEQLVQRECLRRDWEIIATNIHSRYGELDIVARDPAYVLHVVEVKARRGNQYGSAIESLTRSKFSRLVHAVQALRANATLPRARLQIDFVAVDLSNTLHPRMQWFENIGWDDLP